MPSLVVSLLTAVACASTASASDTVEVRAGFARPLDPPSMMGFVHGIDDVRPADRWITPLGPALWRGKLKDVPYGRTTELGGRYTYVVSDRWGYPGDGARPPWEDYGAWARMAAEVARKARGRPNVVLDVWNEPNVGHFWRGTREQLYETYRVAERAIRAELGPSAIVTGPSVSGYRRDWLVGLLEWCRARGCEVNALAWHEFPRGSIPAIAGHAEDARETLLENPRYRAQRIRELHVNEAISAADQYRPGEILGYLHYLEAGGADAAARGCWTSLSGASNCYNDTLGGLLVPGTFQPRSAWWASKAYADGTGSRVLTRFSDPYVVGLASRRSETPDRAQLVIGHLRRPSGAQRRTVNVRVTLRRLDRLAFLKGARRVRVSIEGMPDSGEAPLVKPRGRRGNTHRIVDREVAFTLHDVRLHEAYRLTLSRPGS